MPGKRKRSNKRTTRGRAKRAATATNGAATANKAPTATTWAGTKAKVNTLTGKGKFDPKIPIDHADDEGDDDLIWADPPTALIDRLEEKPQQITSDCLQMNALGILRLFESDVIQHVIKQQLRSEHMSNLLARQITYQEEGKRGAQRSTVNRLAKSSLLGRDPSGEHPIPEEMWDNGELTEQGVLLRDVQDIVWDYLRVHLPRILTKEILDRVEAQEGLYKEFPELRETLGFPL